MFGADEALKATTADSWLSLGSMALATASVLFTAYLGYLRGRDQNRESAERIRLEARFEIQELQRGSNARTISRLEKEVESCHKERDEVKSRVLLLEKKVWGESA